jgi:hypothetical protein
MEYVKRFALWLISGIAFGCGIAVIAWLETRIERQEMAKVVETSMDKTLSLDSVQVATPEVIALVDTLSASTYISSTEKVTDGKSHLEIALQLDVLQNGKVIYSCGHRPVRYSHSGERQRVQLDCKEIRRDHLPPGFTVVAELTSVRLWPG